MHGARGMVITVEIKHHQLWGFSTFHRVPLPKPLLLSLQFKRPTLPLPQALSPPSCPSYFFQCFPSYSTLLHPHIYVPVFLITSLPPLTFLSFAMHQLIPNPLVKITLFPILYAPPVLICTCTHINDHIRQMTLITGCLECKNKGKRSRKHLLYIPNSFRDSQLLCTLLLSRKEIRS